MFQTIFQNQKLYILKTIVALSKYYLINFLSECWKENSVSSFNGFIKNTLKIFQVRFWDIIMKKNEHQSTSKYRLND